MSVVNVIRVTVQSSTSFANWRTCLVGMVIIPLLGVALNLLLGNSIGAPELHPISLASVILAVFGVSASSVVSTAVYDRNIGVLEEVMSRSNLIYWLGIMIPAIVIGFVTGCVISLVLGIFHLGLIIPATVFGSLFGVGAAGVGISRKNPYFLLNWCIAFLPVTTGAIVSLDLYPAEQVFRLLPLTQFVQHWRDGTVTADTVVIQLGYFLLVAVLGIAATRRYVKVSRSGHGLHPL